MELRICEEVGEHAMDLGPGSTVVAEGELLDQEFDRVVAFDEAPIRNGQGASSLCGRICRTWEMPPSSTGFAIAC